MESHAPPNGILYILDGPDGLTPTRVPHEWAASGQWAAWMDAAYETGLRIIGKWERDGATVSTVFVGVQLESSDLPYVFETLVEWDDLSLTTRYASWDVAVRGHEAAVRMMRGVVKGEGDGDTAIADDV